MVFSAPPLLFLHAGLPVQDLLWWNTWHTIRCSYSNVRFWCFLGWTVWCFQYPLLRFLVRIIRSRAELNTLLKIWKKIVIFIKAFVFKPSTIISCRNKTYRTLNYHIYSLVLQLKFLKKLKFPEFYVSIQTLQLWANAH